MHADGDEVSTHEAVGGLPALSMHLYSFTPVKPSPHMRANVPAVEQVVFKAAALHALRFAESARSGHRGGAT